MSIRRPDHLGPGPSAKFWNPAFAQALIASSRAPAPNHQALVPGGARLPRNNAPSAYFFLGRPRPLFFPASCGAETIARSPTMPSIRRRFSGSLRPGSENHSSDTRSMASRRAASEICRWPKVGAPTTDRPAHQALQSLRSAVIEPNGGRRQRALGQLPRGENQRAAPIRCVSGRV
jgi:hypothetical protein